MLTVLDTIQSDLLQILSNHLRAQYSPHESEIIMLFIRRCCASVALEDLRTCHIDNLLHALLSLWHHIQARLPGQLKVRVYNPEHEVDGWPSTHTIVEISNDDMPFLVDSVRSTINDQGILINLMMYTGGMQVRRDESFRIIDILSHESLIAKSSTEAPIYVELDRKLDVDKIEKLQTALEKSLQDNSKAVNDWLLMQKQVQLAKQWLMPRADGKFQQEINEARDFLEWMLAENFIFLGVRDYCILQNNCKYEWVPVKDSGLGILSNTDRRELSCHFLDPASKAFQLVISPRPIVLVKTDIQSNVRRHDYMDCVIIKKWDTDGRVIGERHFVGLYTSVTYRTNPAQVPILRFKIQQILERSQLPGRRSYAWRAMRNILEDFPRDDLLQGARSELLELSKGILHLQERQRVRLFVREDVFRRFYSCLVYVPRDNFNTELRQKIGQILKEELKGTSITFETNFSKSVLARIHFMVSVDPEELRQPDFGAIEKCLIIAVRSWHDDFLSALIAYYGEDKAFHYAARYRGAFPAGYKEQFSARSAVFDIRYMENLTIDNPLEINIYQDKKIFHFKLFRCNHHLPLSDVLPMFENLGLRVLDECPHKITFPNGNIVWINDFEVSRDIVQNVDIALNENNVKEVFKAIWDGRAESDRFNQLILVAGIAWREVMMLRAYARYLKQIGIAYSQTYIAETLIANAAITKQLVALFHLCFDPTLARDVNETQRIENQIIQALNDVASLDQDKIIRRYLNILRATLRTNFYQQTETSAAKKYFSFKFDSHKIAELPEPWPTYEVFVYSPEFEGIHLRAAKVARGGLRWSDRREDFRTEVLSLMKAQQVKNSLIIPQGAKGGFVVKCVLPTDERQVRRDKGIACYKDFIRGLLDITDNLKGQQIVMPDSVVSYDDDDSYLVVAADKGTADFSDIANQLSQEYHFWLDDAFASGGKTGYDHKRMGITARGAWESVKRHFRALHQDIENHDVTVIGIGDMAGDVFGNGMLLSKHIRLIAAFNHLHIFIDPHPNAAISFEERQRLFALPHSAWSDYNPTLISSGGGVFSRAEKSIAVSPEMKTIFNLSNDVITPHELIQSILKANVDLLYNGGIGTFVKATTETHQEAEDRHNDAIRIDAAALRCKVIAEGGNLGLTQLARVEFSLQGGRVYTDFIDNSAGVDCSDHEVNIKILLNDVVRQAHLTQSERDKLLAEMTPQVAQRVLKNNYRQTQAIELTLVTSAKKTEIYAAFIQSLEKQGKLNRALEFLPDDQTIQKRMAEGKGFVRPEIAILLTYSKNFLKQQILASDLPEEDYFSAMLFREFPDMLEKKFAHDILRHHLRREIIATQLTNDIVDKMGLTFVYRMQDETGVSVVQIIKAYSVAKQIFNQDFLWQQLEDLDGRVNMDVQLRMMWKLNRLIRRATRWLLRQYKQIDQVDRLIQRFERRMQKLIDTLPVFLMAGDKQRLQEATEGFMQDGAPEKLAYAIASSSARLSLLDIIQVSLEVDCSIETVSAAYFSVGDMLDLSWFRRQLAEYEALSRWDLLARAAYQDALDRYHRILTLEVLRSPGGQDAWVSCNRSLVERWHEILAALKMAPTGELTKFSVGIGVLADFAPVGG